MDDATPARIDAYRALRADLLRDPHRPLWHLTSPEHGDAMPFDPNGAFHWRGQHHLFHIFQHRDPESGSVIHAWGHLSSIDLLHWRHHPTALDVAPNDPDRSIFSGNAFLDRDGTPTLCYHGVGIGNSLAHARDPEADPALEQWVKHPGNPIVPIPKPGDPGHGVYESWDPHAWVEDGMCHACFGGKIPAHFVGPDWDHLAHTGPFLEDDTLSDDEDDVSCPDFFAIGDRHALVAISHQKGVRWWTGDWDGKRLRATRQDRVTWPGGLYFAPETMALPDGRRILWGWVLDPRPYDPARGWSGVMGSPVEITLDNEGGLRFAPARELMALRYRPTPIPHGPLPGMLAGVATESADLECVLDPGSARRIVCSVRRSPDGAEHTDIIVDLEKHTLSIDFSESGDPDIHHRGWVITPFRDPAEKERRWHTQTAPFEHPAGALLHLRILVDRSVIEVHAGGTRWLVQRVFPTRPDSLGIALSADANDARVVEGTVWEMAPTNPY
ncbi:MAG: glycoside hydrolase family 32 protein [Armatimonadota bacterium]